MLKKSLHYLIRCSFLLMIICLLTMTCSCSEKAEDYFLFLKKSCVYSVCISLDDSKIAEGYLDISFDNEQTNAKFTPTYPAAIGNGKVTVFFSPDSEEYIFDGSKLDSQSIPKLWREIYGLFIPQGSILSMKTESGYTVIETSNENYGESILYLLCSDGTLSEIRHGNLKININQINTEVQDERHV